MVRGAIRSQFHPLKEDMAAQAPKKTNRFRVMLTLFAALTLFATACGGAGGEGTSAGVASLEDVAVADDLGGDEAEEVDPADLPADEAALAFSACMRDQGLDFPDIALDSDGNPDLRSAFEDVDRQGEDFRAAIDVCRDVLANAGFGGGGRAAIGENVEIQDALVEFSDCVRDDGWDVGDLAIGGRPGQNGGNGNGAAPGAGNGDGDGNGRGNQQGGQRGGGFGNGTARFAVGLGLDPEDPAVIETMEKCSPIIQDAFANAGVGQGRGGN